MLWWCFWLFYSSNRTTFCFDATLRWSSLFRRNCLSSIRSISTLSTICSNWVQFIYNFIYLSLNFFVISSRLVCGNGPNVLRVAVTDSALNGTIPSTISALSRLTSFVLSNNKIGGVVPSQIGVMSNLEQLLFERNALHGVLPSQLSKLAKLKTIRLNNNSFWGNLAFFLFWIQIILIT